MDPHQLTQYELVSMEAIHVEMKHKSMSMAIFCSHSFIQFTVSEDVQMQWLSFFVALTYLTDKEAQGTFPDQML